MVIILNYWVYLAKICLNLANPFYMGGFNWQLLPFKAFWNNSKSGLTKDDIHEMGNHDIQKYK